MHQADGPANQGANDRVPAVTRRRVLSVAGLGGVTATLPGVMGSGQDAGPGVIELGGATNGWVGRRPGEIEGETNPTLPLIAGRTYDLTWENVDGAPHNFAIYDESDEAIVRTEIMNAAGETQTVTFEATAAMAEYLCEVHPTTMRAPVEVDRAPEPTPTETPEPTPDEGSADGTTGDPAQPAFEPSIVEEERGDVATVTLLLGDADRADVILGSEALNYVVSFTAVDGNGDGRVTFALDTFLAGREDEPGIDTTDGADEVRDYRRETDALSSPLDAAAYPLEAYVDGRFVAEGILSLQPRETVAARSGVAPTVATPSRPNEFPDHVTRRDDVAAGDWAVVEVRASGLYATLDGPGALDDESLGYELTIAETEALNRAPDEVPAEAIHLITDAEGDRFFAAIDGEALSEGVTYEGAFAVTDANPYVPAGERERVATEFSIVERTATFDADRSRLTVPSAPATLSGTTTVAPGTPIVVSVRGSERSPFRKSGWATVEEDGSWTATVDFSDVEPGTPFTARVVGLSAGVDGVVAAAD